MHVIHIHAITPNPYCMFHFNRDKQNSTNFLFLLFISFVTRFFFRFSSLCLIKGLRENRTKKNSMMCVCVYVFVIMCVCVGVYSFYFCFWEITP